MFYNFVRIRQRPAGSASNGQRRRHGYDIGQIVRVIETYEDEAGDSRALEEAVTADDHASA